MHVASEKGFTLVELIVVIAVIGILAGIVAVFIRNPIEGYLAAVRRAEMADIADTALGRIARDVKAALPNSMRVTVSGSVHYLEFMPVEDGGRYRAEAAGDGSGDVLDFTDGADGSFDVLGRPVDASPGQYLVIFNLGLDGDTDAWQGGNRRVVTSSGSVGNLAFTATGSSFPQASPDRRFFLVGSPVSYVCDTSSGTIRRYWGYAPAAAQATSFNSGENALLATRVKACAFNYDPGASQRMGQLTLWIQLENAEGDNAESVSLYQEVGVNNEA